MVYERDLTWIGSCLRSSSWVTLTRKAQSRERFPLLKRVCENELNCLSVGCRMGRCIWVSVFALQILQSFAPKGLALEFLVESRILRTGSWPLRSRHTLSRSFQFPYHFFILFPFFPVSPICHPPWDAGFALFASCLPSCGRFVTEDFLCLSCVSALMRILYSKAYTWHSLGLFSLLAFSYSFEYCHIVFIL